MKTMVLNFFGSRYVVAINAKAFRISGVRCRAKINTSIHRIDISADVPRHERLKELIHELRHAWIHQAGGLPADAEGDARDVSTFCYTALRAIDDAGGITALMQLEPFELADPDGDALRIADALRRPRLLAALCAGEIRDGLVEWNTAAIGGAS